MCNAHYCKWRKYGDPTYAHPRRARTGQPAIWIDTLINSPWPTKCVIWPFARQTNGYGTVNGQLVHRIVCARVHGGPGPGAVTRHLCGMGAKGCVNPAHLAWGTQAENGQDAVRHGTTTRGVKNPQSKLTESQVCEIRSLLDAGLTRADVSARYGVSAGAIQDIASRKNWGWLD